MKKKKRKRRETDKERKKYTEMKKKEKTFLTLHVESLYEIPSEYSIFLYTQKHL